MKRVVRNFCINSYKATQSSSALLKYIIVEGLTKAILSYYKKKA